MVVFSKPVHGLRQHVPALLSLAAVAAQTLIDLDLAHNRTNRDACDIVRGALNQNLLDWCDDLFGDLADDPQSQAGDTAWIKRSVSPYPDAGFPRTLRHTELLLSILDHLNFQQSAEEVSIPLSLTLTVCTQAVVRDHPELIPCYERMITRLYNRVIARYGRESFLLSRIMMWVLDVSVPCSIRDLVRSLDPSYPDNIKRVMTSMSDQSDVWLFGINSGRLDLAEPLCSIESRMKDCQTWRIAACHTGDMDVVSEVMFPSLVWRDDARLHLLGLDRIVLIRIAVLNKNVPLLRFLFARTIGLLDGVGTMEVWECVRDVETARVLVECRFPYHSAVVHCYRSAPVLEFLLDIGAPCEPTMNLCRYCDYGPYVLDVLVRGWKKNTAIPLDRFMTVALNLCVSPSVLREVIRLVGVPIGNAVLDGRSSRCLLNGRFSYHTVAYMKACLQLGSSVNAVDVDTGQSALLYAGVLRKNFAVHYLLSVGAAHNLRDNRGMSVYDYMTQGARRFFQI